MQIDSCFWQPSLADSLVGLWVGWWRSGLVYGIVTHAPTWNMNSESLTALLNVASVTIAVFFWTVVGGWLNTAKGFFYYFYIFPFLCHAVFPPAQNVLQEVRGIGQISVQQSLFWPLSVRWWGIWLFSSTLHTLLFEEVIRKIGVCSAAVLSYQAWGFVVRDSSVCPGNQMLSPGLNSRCYC